MALRPLPLLRRAPRLRRRPSYQGAICRTIDDEPIDAQPNVVFCAAPGLPSPVLTPTDRHLFVERGERGAAV